MQPLYKEAVRLSKLLRFYVEDLLNTGISDGYNMEIEIAPDAENSVLECDARLISRAVNNLVQNSIKHNPQGCEICISLAVSKNQLILAVTDNGTGLSAEKLQELEEKPHYMESTDERLDLRHGLGLLIVGQVAATHNGDFKLSNVFPQGCEATEDVLTGVHKKNTGQLPQYYIENYHEGIVSKQMFREVQAEIARRNSKSAANQRNRRRGRYNSKYALSERLVCGNCGSPYKRVTWNIHGRKQIVWRCVNRIEYGTKFCGNSPSIPEEELHSAILKAVQYLAANFTDEVAAQINGILHDIQTGEITKPNLQEQLEQTQQEFDRLLEMSLDFDEDTPFLDDRLKKLNSKIKRLKKAIDDSAAQQEKASQPEMLLSAKDLQIQEYDDALTARIIEKITVRSRNEIEIRFIGGYKKTMQLT